MKQDFLTTEFYENPNVTLEVLNQLVKEDLVADMDMYQDGDFLFMEVYDNEKSRDILKKVISDFDEYITYNNSRYASDDSTPIGISALHDAHTKSFERDDEIVWDSENECFVFRGTMENEF
ncbi:hypothetical protein PG623_01120 [Riemerella anatipestifer]|nr:hypothetical protein [Riemerella anatipestifer]